MWISGQYGIWGYSLDHLLNLTNLNLSPTRFSSNGVLNKVNPQVIFVNKLAPNTGASKLEEIYRSTNYGINGNQVISDFKSTFTGYAEHLVAGLYTVDNNIDYLYVLLNTRCPNKVFHLMRTTNANDNATSVSWQELTLPRSDDEYVTGLTIDLNNPNIVYITYGKSIDQSNYPYANGLIYKLDYTNSVTNPIIIPLTKNLPYTYIEANSVTTEKGPENAIYLATEFGVFYTNNQLLNDPGNEWKLLGTKLPHTLAHGIEINYPSSTVRVGTWGRGVWEIPLPCISNSTAYEIQTNTILNSDKRFDRDIIVKSGKSLTINNGAHIYMPENGKIIIEPGAKLFVNNATLTSGCTGMWEGIQVWGNNNYHQWPDANGNFYQGYVNLYDATISNAKFALNLWHPEDFTSTGGIVVAESSDFLNNTQSLHALHYKNFHPITGVEMEYQATFKDCSFKLDSKYKANYEFFKHVDISYLTGIKFYGCEFDLSPDATNVNHYNHGIAAYSAGFHVSPICRSNIVPCTDYIKTTFRGLRSGITVRNFNSTYTFTVKEALFEGLVYGIDNYAANNATILRNEFYVGSNKFEDLCAIGICQRFTTGFGIENNDFFLSQDSRCINHFGIYTMNTNAVDEIYKNSFTDLKYANFAAGKNFVDNMQIEGLKYFCNINNHNYVDFYIQNNTTSGVQFAQGSPSLSTGNEFSQDGVYHIFSGQSHMIYYYNELNPVEVL